MAAVVVAAAAAAVVVVVVVEGGCSCTFELYIVISFSMFLIVTGIT